MSNPLTVNSDVQSILDTEYAHTKLKADSIQNSVRLSQRSAELNDSFKKRYAKYTQLIIILIVGVVAYFCLLSLATAFPIIPSIVIDMLTIALILGCLIYAGSTYGEILTRSQINYDELDIPTIVDLSDNTLSPAAFQSEYASGNLYSFLQTQNYEKQTGNMCVGQDCCPDDFVYDKSSKKCVRVTTATIPIRTGFTTIAEAYVEPRFMPNGADPSKKNADVFQSYSIADDIFGTPL